MVHEGLPQDSRSLCFYDNRERYLLFVATCNEKQIIAERVAMDIKYLQPVSPGLRVFDAGMGVLCPATPERGWQGR